MMSTRSSSSMEQGELEASPIDFRQEYLPSLGLNLEVHLSNNSKELDNPKKSKSPETILDDEDELHIQPPQPVQPIRIKHSKKHSRHRHDSLKRNNSSSSNKEKSSKHSKTHNEVFTSNKEESRIHSTTSSKELDHELQRRLDKQRREEQEQIRRKKAMHERERLEKLERERIRKENELQHEIARIHEQKKLERLSRHSKNSDKKEGSSHKSRDHSSKKSKHLQSPTAKRSRNLDKGRDKDHKDKKYSDKDDFSRSSSTKDLMKMDLTSYKIENVDHTLHKSSSNSKYDDMKSENFIHKERNHLDNLSTKSLKSLNKNYVDNIDEDDVDSDNNNNVEEINDFENIKGKDMPDEFDSDELSSESKFFDPLKIKSKFDDSSDSDDENNATPSVKSDSKSSSIAQSRSPYEIDPSPIPSPVENSLPNYYPALQGCRNVEEFHCLNRIEEGTYGVVYRAVDIKTEEIVALKRLKMEKEKEGFPITSLREINTLLKAQHVNIVTVREIVVGSNMDKIYIVMDYVEHDLKSLMEYMKEPFIIGEVKTLMQQLLRGVNHLHDNWIIHRDLKASNLLLSHKGILKIGDFGLAREYGNPLKQYTPIVVTLWSRSPELLLGVKEYSTAIDIWSVGCIYAELLTKKPLFPGKTEIDELNRIFKELGTPNEKIWPGVSELPAMKKCTFTEYPYNQLRQRFGSTLSDRGFDLMNKLLTYDPAKRVTAEDALRHDFFEESPLPVPSNMFPTWPARSEQVRSTKNNHASSPKPPSGGKAYAKLLDDVDDQVTGFHLNAISSQPIITKGAGFALKF